MPKKKLSAKQKAALAKGRRNAALARGARSVAREKKRKGKATPRKKSTRRKKGGRKMPRRRSPARRRKGFNISIGKTAAAVNACAQLGVFETLSRITDGKTQSKYWFNPMLGKVRDSQAWMNAVLPAVGVAVARKVVGPVPLFRAGRFSATLF